MEETAFVTHIELCRYTPMPFGVKNAPAISQRAMDNMLAPVKWQHALNYPDVVVIFSKSPESIYSKSNPSCS